MTRFAHGQMLLKHRWFGHSQIRFTAPRGLGRAEALGITAVGGQSKPSISPQTVCAPIGRGRTGSRPGDAVAWHCSDTHPESSLEHTARNNDGSTGPEDLSEQWALNTPSTDGRESQMHFT